MVNHQLRGLVRRPDRAPANFSLMYLAAGQKLARLGRASDLSPSGIRISGPVILASGTMIVLQFCLPGTIEEIVTRGKAVMCFFDGSRQEYLHGIAFTHIGKLEQEAIARFVRLSLDGSTQLLKPSA